MGKIKKCLAIHSENENMSTVVMDSIYPLITVYSAYSKRQMINVIC